MPLIKINNFLFFLSIIQKTLPAFTSFVRNISADKTLKETLAEKIPQEQEIVKAFRKSHGSTKVGEVTVDMVRFNYFYSQSVLFSLLSCCVVMYMGIQSHQIQFIQLKTQLSAMRHSLSFSIADAI